MTTKKLSKLTLQEKRVKIAEACGWKWRTNGMGERLLVSPRSVIAEVNIDGGPPDYLNSLDAMHEAEKTQGWHERFKSEAGQQYYLILNRLCHRDGNNTHCATASQRADAFLLTL